MSAAQLEQTSLAGIILDGRYRIEELLGAGGMGVVYRARHVHLQRVVAIKVMRGRHDAAMQQRFLREAQAASMVSHPSIVGITDFGMDAEGQPYLVMEYLDGETLGKVLKAGPLPPERACRIASQIAQGLQAVHEQGIVHRDRSQDPKVCLHTTANLSHRRRTDHVDRQPRPFRSLLLPSLSRESGQSDEQSLRLRSSLDG